MVTPKKPPRPPGRQVLATRMSAEGLSYIKKLAEERGEPISATMRALLVFAAATMPRDHGLNGSSQ